MYSSRVSFGCWNGGFLSLEVRMQSNIFTFDNLCPCYADVFSAQKLKVAKRVRLMKGKDVVVRLPRDFLELLQRTTIRKAHSCCSMPIASLTLGACLAISTAFFGGNLTFSIFAILRNLVAVCLGFGFLNSMTPPAPWHYTNSFALYQTQIQFHISTKAVSMSPSTPFLEWTDLPLCERQQTARPHKVSSNAWWINL